MPQMIVEIPFPHIILHPNHEPSSRRGRFLKSAEKKKLRHGTYLSALEEIAKHKAVEGGLTGLPAKRAALLPIYTFTVRRKRDSDGLTIWVKAARDGLADAGIVEDDNVFSVVEPEVIIGKEKRCHLKVSW